MWVVVSKDKILTVEAKTVKTKYQALGLSKDSFMVIWFTTLLHNYFSSLLIL